MTVPDLDGALRCLGLDPDDPAGAHDVDAVTEIWSRRALGPALSRSVVESGGCIPAPADRPLSPPMSADSDRGLAELYLARALPRRWRHVQGVARRGVAVAAHLTPADGELLVTAAWLHDIGYAPPLATTGFHPLDGASAVCELGVGERLWGLVARFPPPSTKPARSAWPTSSTSPATSRGWWVICCGTST